MNICTYDTVYTHIYMYNTIQYIYIIWIYIHTVYVCIYVECWIHMFLTNQTGTVQKVTFSPYLSFIPDQASTRSLLTSEGALSHCRKMDNTTWYIYLCIINMYTRHLLISEGTLFHCKKMDITYCVYICIENMYMSLAHIKWLLVPLQKDGYHHIVYLCIINMSMHHLLTSDGSLSKKMENTTYFVHTCIYMYWIHAYASFAHIWWPFVPLQKNE